MLSARSLTMEYPGVKALSGVDFELRAGEIHALCGENGAGKSTLIKVLSGIIPHGRYGGAVTLHGAEARFAGPGDALHAGVRVIHQELALCPDLSVAENLCLGDAPGWGGRFFGLADAARMRSEARAELAKLGLDLDVDAPAGSLPVGLRQMVEIARALRKAGAREGETRPAAKILILDEPTSALSAREAARLEEILLRLRSEGYGLLYISHRLDEVFRLADRVTVLRNGESRGTLERGEIEPSRIVALMVGGTLDVSARPAAATGAATATPLLSVRDWTVPSASNRAKNVVDGVSLDLRPGEIVGLAGLMGAGRTELAESLLGLYPEKGRGSVEISGRAYAPRDARRALDRGLALLSEDRRGHGVLPDKSVRVNMTCASLRDYCAAGWLLREAPERAAASARAESLRVKTPGLEFEVGKLSGGNQQKVLLARALMARPKVLILDEPTRGIDVGAKAEIYALIERLAGEGLGVLLISSEGDEILRLSHRVLVMRDGRIAGTPPTPTLENILALASGSSAESVPA
jgi:D-xylose transport system ATP-binding protein